MVQEKLPFINSAHGSETRNIINELIKLFNDMGYTYNESLQKAQDILAEAQRTNDMNENVQQQINTLIAESGTSDAEVLQARFDSDGNEYAILKDRLDTKEEGFKSDISQIDRIESVKSANAREKLIIPTYAPTDHTCHPSVIWDNSKKYGFEWIMSHTPYPFQNDVYENPSIVVSNDGKTWEEPTDLENPIFEPTDTNVSYFSDVNLCDDGNNLIMIYRETNRASRLSRLWLSKSTNAIDWSAPEILFDYNDLSRGYTAPSMQYTDGKYRLYYKSRSEIANDYGYVESVDLISWSEFQLCTFDFGDWEDYYTWHGEFKKHDGVWYSLIHGWHYIPGESVIQDGGKLFVFTSQDGINFNECKLVLAPSTHGFGDLSLYKSSFVFWGSQIWLYYSAFSKDSSAHIGLSISRNGDWGKFVGYNYNDQRISKVNVIDPDDLLIVRKPMKILNTGVSGVQLETTKTDTISITGDNGVKGGYLETSGVFLSTPKNTSIESDKTEGALFQSSTSKNLSIVSGGAVGEIRRSINLIVVVTNGEVSVTYRSGADFVESVTTASYGMDINLKNTSNRNYPTYIMKYTGGLGLQTSDKTVGFDFIRTSTSVKLGIGLMDTVGGTEIPLSSIVSGAVNITIFI